MNIANERLAVSATRDGGGDHVPGHARENVIGVLARVRGEGPVLELHERGNRLALRRRHDRMQQGLVSSRVVS